MGSVHEVIVLPFGPGSGLRPVGILLRRDESQNLYSAYALSEASANRRVWNPMLASCMRTKGYAARWEGYLNMRSQETSGLIQGIWVHGVLHIESAAHVVTFPQPRTVSLLASIFPDGAGSFKIKIPCTAAGCCVSEPRRCIGALDVLKGFDCNRCLRLFDDLTGVQRRAVSWLG
jgi:hypothetical protein